MNWVVDFLTNRQQRVKLSEQCFSEWGQVPAGVPQGTKLGPWLFLLMINDLSIPNVLTWKYVDDTTFEEIVPRGASSEIQKAADKVVDWSKDQRMHLNEDKCKEIRIGFKKNKHFFDPVLINGKDLSVDENAKILGVTISNDLKWNSHVEQAIKKANKRLYFLVQLRRAGVGAESLIKFYCTVIRPVLEYGAQVFNHKLQDYLCEDLERVQKRALSIIAPDLPYQLCLDSFELESLSVRREKLCCKLFNEISEHHNLHSLLPPRHHSCIIQSQAAKNF